jgi:hypothetical protein
VGGETCPCQAEAPACPTAGILRPNFYFLAQNIDYQVFTIKID